MKPDIALEPAAQAQAELLADLHCESFGEAAWSRDQIDGSLSLASTEGWVAFVESEPAGFLLQQLSLPQSEILTLCVRPRFRRNGIGAALIAQMIAANRTRGCATLFLDVAADNEAAIGLYKKHGFAQTAKRARYYARASGAVDALILTLTLDSTPKPA